MSLILQVKRKLNRYHWWKSAQSFVNSSNKQKKPSFEVLVRIIARIHARVHALYLGILKYMQRKHLNSAQ